MNANTGTTATQAVTGGTVTMTKDEPKVIVVQQATKPERTELYHTVHVVGPENGPAFAQMLARAKCTKSKNGVQDADIVFFTGGSVDVHPLLYGADPNDAHESVWFESEACTKTMMEYIQVWQECFYLGIPMVGVCLGAQFLAVMNGAKLFQDIDNHNSGHNMHCIRTGTVIDDISSVHHQSVIKDKHMQVIGASYESNERWKNRRECNLVIDKPDEEDVEAFWYEDTMCLGFQGHPEYSGYPEYTEWCMKQIEHYIIYNSKMAYVDSNLRMKQEALQRRNFTLPNSVHEFIKEYN